MKQYFICVDFMKIDENGFSSKFVKIKYVKFFELCRILLRFLFTAKYKEISIRKERP